jgi:iron complex outermembrane receptor protein
MLTFRFTKKTSVLAVALAIGTMNAAMAQTAEPATELNRITVTGSNIKRINLETASPVQIITREEMVRGGATSLNEVLRTISANVGGIDENRTNGFSAGAAGLNLRGIGSQATLMLINGRRLAAYAQPEFQTTFVDLNSIPIGAVERIEVLKDGASAIYGSEAMAGVVNIILRDSFEGVLVDASIGESVYKDGRQVRSSISVGGGSLVEDHFNAYATLDIRQRKPMFIGNRPDYIGSQNWEDWGYKDARNIYSFPGNIYWTDKATGRFTARTLDPNCPADRLTPAAVFFGAGATGQYCNFDDLKDGTYNSAGKTDRIGITSRATWQPNANITVFAEAMLNRNKAVVTGDLHWIAGQNGQPTPALPITHPQYPKELIGPNGKTLAGGNGTVRVRAQIADFPGQGQDNVTDFARYLVGTKGALSTWDWETAILVNTSKVTSNSSSGLLLTPFVNAYKNGTFILGGPNNAAVFESVKTQSASNFSSGVYQWDAKLSGELMTLPSGPMSMASGIEFRKEFLETNPDPQSVAGELYHTAQSPPGFSNSRNITSLYTELSIPILKSLEAQFAARHDRYSDYGTSTTPKLGLKWNVSPSLMLRSTYAAGFRAPTLVENSTDVRNAFTSFLDPARCNDNFKEGCSWQSPYQSGANPNLKPETANSFTFGAVWEPTGWLNASVDVWRIKRVDEIGTYNLDKVLADPARYANDPAVEITRDPLTDVDRAAGATAGEITNVKSLLTNVSVTEVRGMDIDLQGKFNLGEYGQLKPRVNLMYTMSYKNAPSPTDDLIEYAGTRGTPEVQATIGLGWRKAAWQLSADVIFVGKMSSKNDYTQPCSVGEEGYQELCTGIPSFTTVNLGGSYSGFKDWKISAALQNAFNVRPPFVPYGSVGYYAPLHSAMGRYMQVTAEYRFK